MSKSIDKATSMDNNKGFDYGFGICRMALTIYGLWPRLKNATYYDKSRSFRLIVWLILNILFINLVQTIQLCIMWGDLFAMTDIISTANLPIGLVVFKTFVFIYHKKALLPLLLCAQSDWNSPKSASEDMNMWSNARIARRLSLICLTIGISTVNCHLVVRVCQEMKFIPGKTTSKRELFFNSYFPFDYTHSPIYELTFTIQYVATILITIGYSGLYGLFVALMLHLCAQFANLRAKLDRIAQEVDGTKFCKNLEEIVIRHQFLYDCAEEIEKIFNIIFLGEIIGCTIQFCLQGFYIFTLNTDDMAALILYIIFMIFFMGHIGSHLFICCYVSEKLQEESTSIAKAAYECQWYDLSPKDIMLLVMVINRAKDPIEITAGKFCTYSLSLYAQIFKTSGGYLSMLLAVRDKIT